MPHVLVMPKLGLTMQEATLVRWLVDVGDAVRQGQPLCEIETDKITMEVEAPTDGTMLRRVEAGTLVPVGAGIAVLGEPGEAAEGPALHGDASSAAAPSSDPPAAPAADQPPPARESRTEEAGRAGGRDPVSPVARRLAADLGVDLSTVRGSGPGGRIVRRDVEAAARLPPAAG